MTVKQSGDKIFVSDPLAKNVVIYANPTDTIVFDFDLSTLNSTIVHGDLLLHNKSGGSVTVVNYAIMLMQDAVPLIIDASGMTYGF